MGFVHENGSVGQQASPHRGSSSRMEAGCSMRGGVTEGGRGPAVRGCGGAGEGVAARGGRERIAGGGAGGGAPRQRFWNLRMSLVCSPTRSRAHSWAER